MWGATIALIIFGVVASIVMARMQEEQSKVVETSIQQVKDILAKERATIDSCKIDGFTLKADMLDGFSQAEVFAAVRRQALEEAAQVIRDLKHDRVLTPAENEIYDEALRDAMIAILERKES